MRTTLTAPGPSAAQIRYLQYQFRDLGYDRRARAARLAVAAAALGLDHLDSFNDLTQGQAVRLFCCLRRGEIPEAARAAEARPAVRSNGGREHEHQAAAATRDAAPYVQSTAAAAAAAAVAAAWLVFPLQRLLRDAITTATAGGSGREAASNAAARDMTNNTPQEPQTRVFPDAES